MNRQGVTNRMRELNITVPMLCKELGMNTSTYYRKMRKNGEDFSAAHLLIMKRVLKLDADQAVSMLIE
jgi:hypothetical protein